MPLKRRSRLGQYRIEGLLSTGGFAEVYRAYDTVEGIRVALKIPLRAHVSASTLATFRREVRTLAKLDHPNIMPIKTAGLIGDDFVIVTPLGLESLGDRIQRRMARTTAVLYIEQLLEALAYAHRRKIGHMDLKPENLILFPDNRLRLADFGLARVLHRTVAASGSGTVGYVSPEQALGKPSLRSDVFSAGLILWRLMSGSVPEWPFRWPYPKATQVEHKYQPGLIKIVRKATMVNEQKRYPNATSMLKAYQQLRGRTLV